MLLHWEAFKYDFLKSFLSMTFPSSNFSTWKKDQVISFLYISGLSPECVFNSSSTLDQPGTLKKVSPVAVPRPMATKLSQVDVLPPAVASPLQEADLPLASVFRPEAVMCSTAAVPEGTVMSTKAAVSYQGTTWSTKAAVSHQGDVLLATSTSSSEPVRPPAVTEIVILQFTFESIKVLKLFSRSFSQ